MHIKSNMQTGLSLRERKIIDAAIRLGKTIIHTEDLIDEFKLTREGSNLILSRLFKKGWLQRLKAGVYRIVPLGSDTADPVPEDAWSIAMELFEPGYIGGWTAAEQLDLTEQIFNTTFVFTSTIQRKTNHEIAALRFKTKFTAKENIFGTNKLWSENKPVLISDLNRTLTDIFDDPATGGGGRAMVDIAKSYRNKKEANFDTLWQYASKLDHGAVFKRLGLIGETILKMPADILEKIKHKCNSGIILLDPAGPVTGPVKNKWGVRINIPLEDLS